MARRRRNDKPVVLLSGGNPQIAKAKAKAKADGDAPVQAYIAAMPGFAHSKAKESIRPAERGHLGREVHQSKLHRPGACFSLSPNHNKPSMISRS